MPAPQRAGDGQVWPAQLAWGLPQVPGLPLLQHLYGMDGAAFPSDSADDGGWRGCIPWESGCSCKSGPLGSWGFMLCEKLI